tara:strand:+ start:199 stop:465 length:267 start_codon:yes stop_codon:yes gene_type:complete
MEQVAPRPMQGIHQSMESKAETRSGAKRNTAAHCGSLGRREDIRASTEDHRLFAGVEQTDERSSTFRGSINGCTGGNGCGTETQQPKG